MSFLEESWEEREEKLYKQVFGETGPGIYALSAKIFDRMNAKVVDPRWLHHGVFKSGPTKNRSTWAYVTSGMSNPWESDVPEEYSGLGVEFVMETEEEEGWAIEILQTLMAYNLLLAAGQMGDFPVLSYGHRVPLALSDNIISMMFAYPVNYPNNLIMRSGKIELLQAVGITHLELAAAKETSSEDIRNKLISATGGLVTCKYRQSVV